MYSKLNPYYINRQGRVIRANADGSTTALGLKATLVGIALTNAVALACMYYGWQARKAIAEIENAPIPEFDLKSHMPQGPYFPNLQP